MPPVGFEPTISESERPQTYALDRAATGTGSVELVSTLNESDLDKTLYLLHATKLGREPEG